MNTELLHDAHDVFCEVFHSELSYESFRHKHMDNPELAEELVTIVDYQNGTPAGTNSFMAGTMLCGQKELYFVNSCDTAVKSCYRGRHIFLSIIQQAIQKCQDNGIAFILAIPNQNSYPGFVKLGFQEVGTEWTYISILRPLQVIRKKILHREGKLPVWEDGEFTDATGHIWQASSTCPFTEKDFAAINDRSGLHIRHTRDLYRWKIDCYPKEKRKYICIHKDGELCAYFIVLSRGNGNCTVCDWMLPEDKNSSRRIIKGLAKYLKRSHSDIAVPLVNPERGEPDLLRPGGFVIKRKGLPLLFYLTAPSSVGEEELACMSDFKNWILRFVDGDTILNI